MGNPISLKQEGQDIEGAVWTPDGKDILYSVFGADENASIMRVRAKLGARPVSLTFAHEVPFWPSALAISPRGNRLAYTEILYYAQIAQMLPGKAATIFSPSTRLQVPPQYSPDGNQVVFASNRSGVVEIWTCNADGSNSAQVTHFGSGFSGSPRWSPDGRSIAFDHEGNRGWRIFVTATDGSDVRKLTLDDRRENIPSWSADGNWIYYASNQTGRFEIWKAHVKGGKGIQVTRNGGYTAFESPDGQSLYYTKSESAGLWKLSLQGGKEEQILDIDVGRDFAVTRDGIYYIPVHRPHTAGSILFHSFTTGKELEIASLNMDAADDGGLTISPDHKSILFSALLRADGNVMIVDNVR